ncbi:major facilitator superfamily domain-containing protein [Colletotrichum phormii]|uniref:Major facilitator superfamily domain-containing protein n=1 Tax=Colletotrichum phormii TaxID=359342 RepID=A0AAI9ZUZ6_9PEZI|nr:major facilitator superfamily domain-containing protein [Colletotrichum phormii]KAK1638697.1 major facilitator superfamily domain-containing protein [Colletotrichum phormii]
MAETLDSKAAPKALEMIRPNTKESQAQNLASNSPRSEWRSFCCRLGRAGRPEHPLNWSDKKKGLNIAILSLLSIVTPLGSSMFAPGIPLIMKEFHDDSSITATFLLSIYVLGFALGPLLVAPMSELYGRRYLYTFGNILFTVFTIGTALSNSIGMLLAFRLFMGLSGVVPLTIGSGSIADMMPPEKRGRAVSIWALGPLLGPCVGPVAGGYLIRAAGWRWVFWLISILAGTFIPVSILGSRETYPPALLESKASRLRKKTQNKEIRSRLEQKTPMSEKLRLAAIRPIKLLVATPVVTLNALYIAISYGILYLLVATFTFVYCRKNDAVNYGQQLTPYIPYGIYTEHYGFDEGSSGLSFLPAGIGMVIGVIGFGQLTDLIVKRTKARGLEHKPEDRLKPIMTVPCALALPFGLFLYGWTVQNGTHWIVPMFGVMVMCIGLMGTMYAASVTAALTILRSLLGALLPLSGLEMYEALGLGWGNSLLGFIALSLVPILCHFISSYMKISFRPRRCTVRNILDFFRSR